MNKDAERGSNMVAMMRAEKTQGAGEASTSNAIANGHTQVDRQQE